MKHILRLLGEDGEEIEWEEVNKLFEKLKGIGWIGIITRGKDNNGWRIQFEKEKEVKNDKRKENKTKS